MNGIPLNEHGQPILTKPRVRSLHQQKVDTFMRLGGQELPEQPTMPGDDVRLLRARLIMEEAMETIEKGLGIKVSTRGAEFTYDEITFHACGTPDLVELVDGCADLRVVTTGCLSSAGIADSHIQDLVDENNLAKFGPGSYRREDGKIMKPPGHKPPDLVAAINLQLAPDSE